MSPKPTPTPAPAPPLIRTRGHRRREPIGDDENRSGDDENRSGNGENRPGNGEGPPRPQDAMTLRTSGAALNGRRPSAP
ncbi:hypothetical protein GCM10023220_37720 [Streptomyces ziwulingensis]|uniref:Uncharacterized protein n=1 Tax=Streptomyces ziwulingensis TaxID=1045501 RepID=A0ABP9C3U0_9ACTN